MITIIAGTNRVGSNTKKIALIYKNFLVEKNIDCKLLSLEDVDIARTADFELMEEGYLNNSEKFIFVVPEYNGSFSGVLKLLIDNSNVKTAWPNKKALLVGVATGRAGNLRGLEHLSGVLMHLKMIVHPNRLPISSVHTLLNEAGEIIDAGSVKTIHTQIEEFINF